ncbi:UDP-N-acetylmuramoyl-L-alanine--D-glutamate ligase [Candidatus Kinetoplastidibacterium crithidiae]|uniref:UDP-N-acetylmuramoylalanine--D-glutamate ligase n=1 Tax=Candidatus Kinetoplastidibacterium crithidiae TCC036E TaxID=1208918 RepID=M1LXC2_9PROT|nr:UDP-N-acetylmuramoyl-L-alanine--D-glutamate ligase [Candidatus Kinetoplastibacterium crithidii]AFZ82485.1 UDP-N-acetylmuramoyl-L-alanyl-D-glutamate synthetase [Candidatus Kinetoplastibacterium crithidii (ex Angomonas deanei ATCC 30255)]AGF47854.1 UDP-N-acetylmuramoylalanine--D-glutamate ligase [Candidatus Kinetoplastibacterium crithidii TCC036E]
MKIQNNPLVMIIGLGDSGLFSAWWCLYSGFDIIVVDSSIDSKGVVELKENFPSKNITSYLGCNEDFYTEWLIGVAYIVISPGISPNKVFGKKIFAAANEKNIEIIGDIELFARALSFLKIEYDYNPKIIAITGTNGKTTVTSLTYEILKKSGVLVCKAGNIGPPVLKALMDEVEQDVLPEVWVLEISSFQLYTIKSLCPDVSVVLNLDFDHIDWHGTVDSYWETKVNLLRISKTSIINRNDHVLMQKMLNSKIDSYSFGSDVPTHDSCFGLVTREDSKWLVVFIEKKSNSLCKISNDDFNYKEDLKKGFNCYLLKSNLLKIRGIHNYTNVLASLQLISFIMPLTSSMLKTACDYLGEPHRIQFVAEIGGVSYFDDSKGTNISATITALKSFDKKTILIMGGVGKNQDFSYICSTIAEYAKIVILIGVDSSEIFEAIKIANVPCFFSFTMEDAVLKASSYASRGDVVLLSPACASFDMFDNYSHRGNVFSNAVMTLAKS